MTLLIDDDDRYSRLRLIAWWDQEKLSRAKILVVGAGALGNEVLKNLALLGVGTIFVVDQDQIEQSNLTRSILFRRRDCGRPKAVVAAEAIQDINPDSRVRPLAANVITGVGLGLFDDVDVVIGCLDNREARLWLNRQCWKVSTPWIDGGIQEISGVVKVFVPPESACYECAMTENDYRLINLRYSCPLLRQEDLAAGKVPTAPTISSVIAGLQTQEALKLIHQMPVAAGEALVFNGVANRFYQTAFQRRDDCLSHETYPRATPVPLSVEQHSAADLFQTARQHLDGREPRRVLLDRDLVVSINCSGCGTTRQVFRPQQDVGIEDARCPQCGELAKPTLQHSIDVNSDLAGEKLAALGIPPYDIVRVQTEDEEHMYLLEGDRGTVWGSSSLNPEGG
jgi:adenylyltransferase/sulfurtransferase